MNSSFATGGGTITDPNVAYVRSDGVDATGIIGRVDKPFLTWQGAGDAFLADDPNRTTMHFDFGVGSFGDWIMGAFTGALNVYMRGAGYSSTALGSVTGHGQSLTLWDSGAESVEIGDVTNRLGSIGAIIVLQNVVVNEIFSNGIAGTGGNGGQVILRGTANAISINSSGGSGTAGTGIAAGGNGGNGGNVTMSGPSQIFTSITASKGAAGSDGGAGAGAAGNDGVFNFSMGCRVPTPTPNAGITAVGVIINGTFVAVLPMIAFFLALLGL